MLCRAKLSASEALLLREVFPQILASHHDQVWNRLRRRASWASEAAQRALVRRGSLFTAMSVG